MLSNCEDYGVTKKLVEISRTNRDKMIKLRCKLKNKLIIFTYYLELFFILSRIIKLFYSIYLMT